LITEICLQHSALAQVIQLLSNGTAFHVELCITYWRPGQSGLPLKLFHRTSNGGWALGGNWAPVDESSILNAIEHIRNTRTAPLPSFDLSIRYHDGGRHEKPSQALVKIRYRSREGDVDSPLTLNSHALAERLECEFHGRVYKEVHRDSWIYDQLESDPDRYEYDEAAMNQLLAKLQEDYAKAFPENGHEEDSLSE
jgi:hypothetical protein